MIAPTELNWTDLPALPGVKIAVIEGPLTEAVPIMFRLKFPPNYRVPPHWHPGIEHVTVISGTLNMGIGDEFDTAKTRALSPGSVAIMPPRTHHFVWTREDDHRAGPQHRTLVGHLRQSCGRPQEQVGDDGRQRQLSKRHRLYAIRQSGAGPQGLAPRLRMHGEKARVANPYHR